MISSSAAGGHRVLPSSTADPLVGSASRYVVGVDGSAASRAALVWAAARASSPRTVHLLGVVDAESDGMAGDVPADAPVDVGGRLAGILAATRAEILRLHPGCTVTSGLRHGPVAPTLAEESGPDDLLVIGSDKTGYARGRLVGFRAIQVAAAVTGPLVVVPSVDLRLRTGVAVAVAELASAAVLARLGAQEAARTGCSVSLVQVPVVSGGVQRAEHCAEVLDTARCAAQQACPHVEVRVHTTERRPAEAILNLSRDRALLLIARSRRTAALLGVGETLAEVLLNANAPTAVIP